MSDTNTTIGISSSIISSCICISISVGVAFYLTSTSSTPKTSTSRTSTSRTSTSRTMAANQEELQMENAE